MTAYKGCSLTECTTSRDSTAILKNELKTSSISVITEMDKYALCLLRPIIQLRAIFDVNNQKLWDINSVELTA